MTEESSQIKLSENKNVEYTEACENIRHYSTILSTVLTVFITVFAGLVAFGFEKASPNDVTQLFLRVSGLISTLMFWILAERASSYWYHFLNRASQLEEKLGYSLHSNRPKPRIKIISTQFATRALFLSIAVFWGVAIWSSV